MKDHPTLRTKLEAMLENLDEAENQISAALDEQPMDIDGHIMAALETVGDIRNELATVLRECDLPDETPEPNRETVPGNFCVIRP